MVALEWNIIMAAHRFDLSLQVKIGRYLTTDEKVLTTSFAGKSVTIKSRGGGKLSKTEWIIFEVHGFTTKAEALDFGEQLRTNVQLAGLCSRLGTDTGQEPTVREYDPSVINMMAGPAYAKATATPILPPEHFLSAMETFAQQLPLGDRTLLLSVRLLNLAFINPEWLAQVVLSFAAVEAMAEDQKWSDGQRARLRIIAAETSDPEVREAVERLHKIGVRQGIKRVLRDHQLEHLQKEWDRRYNLRSALFHGGKQLSEKERIELHDAVKFCARIVLGVLKHRGFTLPDIATEHFGDI